MRQFSFLPFAFVLLLVIGLFVWLIGTTNPVTPPGYVGYLKQGAVFGSERFYDLQMGPSSPGRGWLLSVINISVTPYTYTEEFVGENSVMAKDNLKIAFRVHLVWRVNPERVREFVEKYTTLSSLQDSDKIVKTAYENTLREPLRTFARDEIQKLDALDIKMHIVEIGDAVTARLLALAKDMPFDVKSVVVGNIQYPSEVEAAISAKIAATQILDRKRIEIAIEEVDKQKRIVQAEGIAKSMEIIQAKLSAQYLQHEAIEAQKAMVNSPNHTTIYIPVGPMGVPLVGTLDALK